MNIASPIVTFISKPKAEFITQVLSHYIRVTLPRRRGK